MFSRQTCRYTNSAFKLYRTHSRGFTLFEVIIVLALTVAVLVMAYSALYFSSSSSAKTRALVLKKSEILKIFHEMRFQIINTAKSSGPCFHCEEGTEAHRYELYFLTNSLKYTTGVGEVGYKIIKDKNGDPHLAYTEFPYPRTHRFALSNPEDKWTNCSDIIKGLDVEFGQKNMEQKEWTSDDLPGRVKVTLWYESDEEEGKLLPYTFIIIPGLKTEF
ncbi:MAG: prepilin-type N-terminal cleavage/methylation domain-containing protein [Firmicutes bacterium]|nr:prepilin-type N-terminal cleavage/methylation domain-containing protein [Bacillota bacterium]